MARITHPRPELGAQKFIGIQFRDGVAEVDDLNPNYRDSLIQHGFTIEETSIADSTFEPLPEAVEGDTAVRLSKPSKRSGKDKLAKAENPSDPASSAAPEGDSGFAVVELADGTVVGDGTSIVTLHTDGTATIGD